MVGQVLNESYLKLMKLMRLMKMKFISQIISFWKQNAEQIKFNIIMQAIN